MPPQSLCLHKGWVISWAHCHTEVAFFEAHMEMDFGYRKVCWNFAITINGASSCVDFMTMNPDKEQTFSTSVQGEEVFMLTSRGLGFFFPIDWKGKHQPFHLIFITLAPIFLKSWYNIQSNYITAFCILHNSLPLKLISYTHANDMIFFCSAATFHQKKKKVKSTMRLFKWMRLIQQSLMVWDIVELLLTFIWEDFA